MFINHEDQFQENIIQWHYHIFINLLSLKLVKHVTLVVSQNLCIYVH